MSSLPHIQVECSKCGAAPGKLCYDGKYCRGTLSHAERRNTVKELEKLREENKQLRTLLSQLVGAVSPMTGPISMRGANQFQIDLCGKHDDAKKFLAGLNLPQPETRRKESWRQDTPKKQLIILLQCIEGDVSNMEVGIGNSKHQSYRVYDRIKQIKELVPWLEKGSW